jgi:hypothetical protein
MALVPASNLHRQIGRATRRLFLQTLLDAFVWSCATALVLGAIWFVGEPSLLEAPAWWLRWAVAGGLVGGAILVALALAFWRRPSRLTAALTLDQKFGLKERVTTSLMLEEYQRSSSAGQALLADVNQRIAEIDVGSRFPVRMSWTAVLVPSAALLLAMVAVFYEPPKGQAKLATGDNVALASAAKEEMEKKLDKLAKKDKQPKPEDPLKTAKIKELDEDIDQLLGKPRDNQDQLRERVKNSAEMEDKIKDDIKNRDDKADAIKEQLQQMDRLSKKDKNNPAEGKNGPGDELKKAVDQGDLEKAKDEMDRLSKKLKDKDEKLNEEEKDELHKQLKDVEDKLERLSRQQEEEEEQRLKELSRKGEIDPDQLDREIEQLKKNSDKLDREDKQDLQNAADELKKAEECMKEGNDEEAAEHMAKAAQKMDKLEGGEERKQMVERIQRVRQIKKTMAKGMQNQNNDDKNKNQNGPGGVGRGSGRRPEAKDGETGSVDEKADSEFDKKGQKNVVGYAPSSKKFPKKSSAEVAGEIKQASQEAPEAIERMRIPKQASDMTKGYFEKLGNQKDDKAKPDEKK